MQNNYDIYETITLSKSEFDDLLNRNLLGDDPRNFDVDKILHVIECDGYLPTGNFMIVQVNETMRYPYSNGQILKVTILTKHLKQ